ncbi:MAG: MmgE/PrpD family protein [Pseudomonadota bacterium]
MPTTTKDLAEFVVKTNFEDFDAKTVHIAKELLFDGLGAMIRGARERVSQIAITHVKNIGGVAEVGIMGGGFRTSITNAALVNGISAHSAEQEAVGKYGGSCTFVTIPAAFNMAEKLNLSGKTVIEGFILGQEVQGKIGMNVKGGSNRGWSSTYYSLGSAVTASKMLGLNVMETQMAIGIAANYPGGCWRLCGTMMHFGETGFACELGVRSALMVKEGVTADPEMIEGDSGFAQWLGEYDLAPITKDLGNPYYIVTPGSAVKKYGCCYGMHRALDAEMQIIQENNITFDQVESVHALLPKFVTRLLHYPNPQNAEQAKFSLEHALGVGIADGEITLEHFTEAAVKNPKYQKARKKVTVEIFEKEGGRTLVGAAIPVTIKLKDGRSFTKEAQTLKGGPESRLTKEELVARFGNHVKGVLTPAATKKAVEMSYNLENLPNIKELMTIATFGYA